MVETLFASTPSIAPGSASWRHARDGDTIGLALYERHYSARQYRDGRQRLLFVGPGEKMVLLTHDDSALFAWRRFISDDGQTGINCAVFRNEGAARSSDLIREADALADERWPGGRHYTYVAPTKIASSNPGYCFLMAGWLPCGWTKGGHGRDPMRILERAA